MQKIQFLCAKNKVTIFQNEITHSSIPIVYINVFEEEGAKLWEMCHQLGCPAFTLVTIHTTAWHNDLTPWEHPPIFQNDSVYEGNAKAYLEHIVCNIMPQVEAHLSKPPLYSALVGYSLGGLFAAFAAYYTTAFHRFASISGSLWYPNFISFATSHKFLQKPQCFYLSLGDKEARTRNILMQQVLENTKTYFDYLKNSTIPSILEMNPGNHYNESTLRTAKGILWLLLQ